MPGQKDQVNLQQMAELEYCLQKYYNENYAPVLSGVKKELDARKADESARYYEQNWSPFVEPSLVHHSQVRQLEWNSKDSEYVVRECMDRITQSDSITADNGTFVSQRYKELTDDIGTNLGTYYFLQRLEDMQLHQLAKYELPLKSIFFLQAMERSWIGLAGTLTSSKRQSVTEQRVQGLANRLDNPSLGRRLRDEAGALAIDTSISALATGGVSLSTVGIDATFRVGFELWNPLGGKTDHEKSEEERSLKLFNYSTTVRQIIDASRKVKSSQSLFVHSLNKELNNKMKVQRYNPVITPGEIQQVQAQIKSKFVGKDKGEALLEVTRSIQKEAFGDPSNWDFYYGYILNQPDGWMMKQNERELANNASWWASLYYQMVQRGKAEMNVNGMVMERAHVGIKAVQYAEALYRVQHGHSSSFYSYREENEEEVEQPEVTADEFFGLDKAKQQNNNNPSIATTSSHSETAKPSSSETGNTTMPSDYQSQNPPSEQLQSQHTEQSLSNPYQPNGNGVTSAIYPTMPPNNNLDMWGDLLDAYGLSNFGSVGKNFGQVLARLPEIMIGMFTGKLSNLKVNDNLLPLASIMVGLFLPSRTNPFLKFLFLGLGGLNLLNKAGHSLLEGDDSSKNTPIRTYKKYEDEPLNSRISKPFIKGGTLVADIDGTPLVLRLNDHSVEAYEKGLLPLNTLANAALRSWDERHEVVAKGYDYRQIDIEEVLHRNQRVT